MEVQICRGDVVYAAEPGKLSVFPESYVIVKDGFVDAVLPALPEEYAGAAVTDYGRGLIIPAFSDLHIHASQFLQRGLGMDRLLFDWLKDYTFPQEARFADLAYAERVYRLAVDSMVRHGTLHSAVFTTLHYEASDLLFRLLDERGLYAYVGKVNMDRNSPPYLTESTADALRDTERFLAEHTFSRTVKPILTPRFAPTCTEELLKGLGRLAKKYSCGVQTHLVESLEEAKSAVELFPGVSCDAEIYERCGLLDGGPSIFAHVIFPSGRDFDILKRCGSIAVHCPDATANITAGIMPAAFLLQEGLPIALGTDIGSGAETAVYRQVARAVQLSKLKEFFEPFGNARISFAQAFYMATKGGGAVFDRVGSLEPGYRFHALVLSGIEDEGFPLSPEERLERFCYAGDDRNIIARYLDGKELQV